LHPFLSDVLEGARRGDLGCDPRPLFLDRRVEARGNLAARLVTSFPRVGKANIWPET
jgi:hypothetical protein